MQSEYSRFINFIGAVNPYNAVVSATSVESVLDAPPRQNTCCANHMGSRHIIVSVPGPNAAADGLHH